MDNDQNRFTWGPGELHVRPPSLLEQVITVLQQEHLPIGAAAEMRAPVGQQRLMLILQDPYDWNKPLLASVTMRLQQVTGARRVESECRLGVLIVTVTG